MLRSKKSMLTNHAHGHSCRWGDMYPDNSIPEIKKMQKLVQLHRNKISLMTNPGFIMKIDTTSRPTKLIKII